MNVVLFGPPASGKGTQAKVISKTLGIPQISTGEILRAAVANHSPLGFFVQAIMARGDLVPDEIVTEAIAGRLRESDCENGAIFDGYPRTLAQAKALDALVKRLRQSIAIVIELRVPDAILLDRVKERLRQGSTRADDNPETLKNRLKVYHANTKPLLAYYRKQRKLKTIDGTAPIDEVTRDVQRVLPGSR